MLRKRRTQVSVVTFVTRAGCSMCAEAQPIVERAAREAGAVFQVVDVDGDVDTVVDSGDAAGLAVWSDHVPVVLLDGVRHAQWWVDEKDLRQALGVRV